MGVEWKEMEEPLAKFTRDFTEEAAEEMCKNNVSVKTKIVTGKPGEKIVEIAEEEGVDAIVMGTHGWTGLARAVIGSVADRVVRHASCPVILVPSKA